MSQQEGTATSGDLASEASAVDQPARSPENNEVPARSEIAVNSAEFPTLGERKKTNTGIPLDRFYDVTVRVWAELGQVTLPIGEMLQLGEGAVMKLARPVSDPIDLVAQGVPFAKGEVVVVDDCFAVRITEIDSDRLPNE